MSMGGVAPGCSELLSLTSASSLLWSGKSRAGRVGLAPAHSLPHARLISSQEAPPDPGPFGPPTGAILVGAPHDADPSPERRGHGRDAAPRRAGHHRAGLDRPGRDPPPAAGVLARRRSLRPAAVAAPPRPAGPRQDHSGDGRRPPPQAALVHQPVHGPHPA